MQVQQRMNNQPAFGARNVIIEESVAKLGRKTFESIKASIPELKKMGDDKLDLTIDATFFAPDVFVKAVNVGELTLKAEATKLNFFEWLILSKKEIATIKQHAVASAKLNEAKGIAHAQEYSEGFNILDIAKKAIEKLETQREMIKIQEEIKKLNS